MKEWLPLAQQLKLGGHAKHPHYCGDGRPLVVFHTDTKWSAYCHRCGNLGAVFKPLPTLQERVAAADKAQRIDDEVQADRRPPMPAVFDVSEWPLEARVWLFKAGFSHDEIRTYGCYYHPPTRRVVLPVVENGLVTFWQARRIFGLTGAKYLSMPGGRESTLPLYGSGSTVTLVEDLLSCFKISSAGLMSLCLMGTSLLSPAIAWLLANPAVQVLIWLDPDAAGMNAAGSIQKQLALCGINSRLVSSERDPKFHSKQDILNVIGRISTTDDANTEGLRQVGPGSELASIRTTDGGDPH